MEETYVMNEVKELCCYVTTDLKSDMETCRLVGASGCLRSGLHPRLYIRSHSAHNHIVQDYVLPDFATRRKGRVRVPEEDLSDSDQVLRMNNERFLVPEILFRPDDIGGYLHAAHCYNPAMLTSPRTTASGHPGSDNAIHRALAAEIAGHVLGERRRCRRQRKVPWLPRASVGPFIRDDVRVSYSRTD
jgi:hypothetical protein